MAERIEVKVIPFPDRPALQLQWRDPVDGQRKTRSARTSDLEQAERARADLEYELNHGLHVEGARVSWQRFRELFEAEYLPGVRPGTQRAYANIFDHFERISAPTSLDAITARTLSQFVAALRERLAPASIFARMAAFRAALRWAQKQQMLDQVPEFPVVKVPKKRPQPVAVELYERLYDAAPDSYTRAYLACGWLAGLRLSEAQKLCWEPFDCLPWLDFPRRRVWIPAEFAKAVEDQWVPLDPELQRLLEALPRQGEHVFPWHELTQQGMSQRIIDLAKRAGVPLTMRSLRRGFGCRYAAIVPAQTLQRLLRHGSINTTLNFYANLDAAAEEAIFSNRNGGSIAHPMEKPSDGLNS